MKTKRKVKLNCQWKCLHIFFFTTIPSIFTFSVIRSCLLLSLENHPSFPQNLLHFCCAHLRAPADAARINRAPHSKCCTVQTSSVVLLCFRFCLMFHICNRNDSAYKLNIAVVAHTKCSRTGQCFLQDFFQLWWQDYFPWATPPPHPRITRTQNWFYYN